LSILFCVAGVEIGLRATGNFAPASFHKLKPNSEFKDVETDWNVVYKTNSLGFRDEEHPVEKTKGLTRIVVLGDSFTFGQGCERAQIFPDVLQSRLRAQGYQAEVLNISDIGIGPEAYFVLFKDVVRRFQPDVVVINVFGNDASQIQRAPWLNRVTRTASHYSNFFTLVRTVRRQLAARGQGDFWSSIGKQSTSQNGPDSNTQTRIDNFRKRYGSAANNLLASCTADPNDVARWINTEVSGSGWREFSEYLVAINQMAQQINCKFLLAVVPDGAQVDPHQLEIRQSLGVPLQASSLTETPGFQTLVRQFAERNKIAYFDPLEEFRHVRFGLYFATDLHWTPAGHRLYAESLARELIQLNFVSRNPQAK
jgi:lysophospholipase L1-like esterase